MKLSDLIPEPSDRDHLQNNEENLQRIGMAAIQYENALFTWLDALPEYHGCSCKWTKIGEFTYLFAWGDETPVTISGNYTELTTTLEMATLVANLMLYSGLAGYFHSKDDEVVTEYFSNGFHRLRGLLLDWWDENPDSELMRDIFKIID